MKRVAHHDRRIARRIAAANTFVVRPDHANSSHFLALTHPPFRWVTSANQKAAQ